MKEGPDFEKLLEELGSASGEHVRSLDQQRCKQEQELRMICEDLFTAIRAQLRAHGVITEELDAIKVAGHTEELSWELGVGEKVARLLGAESTMVLAVAYHCSSCGWVLAQPAEWSQINGALSSAVCRICRTLLPVSYERGDPPPFRTRPLHEGGGAAASPMPTTSAR